MQSSARYYIDKAKSLILDMLIDKYGRPRRKPLFTTQIEVALEGQIDFWNTIKALHELYNEGKIDRIIAKTKYAGGLAFYYARKLSPEIGALSQHIKSKAHLVGRYASPKTTHVLGAHLEALVKAELRAHYFTIVGIHTNTYGQKLWTKTAHNLDFIAEHQSGRLNIGVEVKNTFDVPEREEVEIKIKMCNFFGLRPVFATRWILPYVGMIDANRGLGWMFKTQMYPLGYETLVEQIYKKLKLPVIVRTELPERCISVLATWVKENIAT